jgi:hypothetical protein
LANYQRRGHISSDPIGGIDLPPPHSYQSHSASLYPFQPLGMGGESSPKPHGGINKQFMAVSDSSHHRRPVALGRYTQPTNQTTKEN